MPKNSLLSCKNLKIGYHQSLATLDFELKNGEVVHICGSNGSGKSTFLKTILGFVSPLSGTFDWKIPSHQIAYLPQLNQGSGYFSFTLGEILELFSPPKRFIAQLPSTFLNKSWNHASGGEKQKTLILSRLSPDIQVFVLDEPFNHLDTKNQNEIEDTLVELQNSHSELSFIIVSHQAFKKNNLVQKKITL